MITCWIKTIDILKELGCTIWEKFINLQNDYNKNNHYNNSKINIIIKDIINNWWPLHSISCVEIQLGVVLHLKYRVLLRMIQIIQECLNIYTQIEQISVSLTTARSHTEQRWYGASISIVLQLRLSRRGAVQLSSSQLNSGNHNHHLWIRNFLYSMTFL